ncbi:MAG: type III pantothenate kinase [Phycisphaerales bacterium]|nr:type III pantothenate kinase [Planctomycetota bacterium]MCH8507216.1 type III pantothenate kinase [Phycisphaerales bacterium]
MSQHRHPGPDPSEENLIALAVGNTRARIGLYRGWELVESAVHPSRDAAAIAGAVRGWLDNAPGDETPVVMAAVHREAADAAARAIEGRGITGGGVMRIGRDVPVRIRHSLSESGERTVGQDRLLCAIGAFRLCGQACVVVDLGTALTVDFVDGQGVFHGGAIAPGLHMMLRAMHEQTDALPQVDYAMPGEGEHFGKDTPSAMRLGVTAMVRGAVRWLAEQYAVHYEAYPKIIATGGDMGVLESDGLVENFVPDLQLLGIRTAWETAHEDADADATA